jgi:hypothetical protein
LSQNNDFDDDENPYAREWAEEAEADEAYERAMQGVKSPFPNDPNFDAGVATERDAMIHRHGIDPEQSSE